MNKTKLAIIYKLLTQKDFRCYPLLDLVYVPGPFQLLQRAMPSFVVSTDPWEMVDC